MNDRALEETAAEFRTSVEAVALAVQTYEDMEAHGSWSGGAPEMGRRLEVDGAWASRLAAMYFWRLWQYDDHYALNDDGSISYLP